MNIIEEKQAQLKYLLEVFWNEKVHCPWDDEDNDNLDTCQITGLSFPNNNAQGLSCNNIAITPEGPVWMGLWCGDEVVVDDDGLVYFPMWMKSILMDKCGFDEEVFK